MSTGCPDSRVGTNPTTMFEPNTLLYVQPTEQHNRHGDSLLHERVLNNQEATHAADTPLHAGQPDCFTILGNPSCCLAAGS